MLDYWKENGIKKPEQIIVCAACMISRCQPILISARHWDKNMRDQFNAITEKNETPSSAWEQGFIDQFGNFITREEALKIVLKNKQALRTPKGELSSEGSLFSEDLYY